MNVLIHGEPPWPVHILNSHTMGYRPATDTPNLWLRRLKWCLVMPWDAVARPENPSPYVLKDVHTEADRAPTYPRRCRQTSANPR